MSQNRQRNEDGELAKAHVIRLCEKLIELRLFIDHMKP
jgi:hypothetical protein